MKSPLCRTLIGITLVITGCNSVTGPNAFVSPSSSPVTTLASTSPQASPSPPQLTSCLFLADPRFDFRIQCQATASFYLSFNDKRTGTRLDLKTIEMKLRLFNAQGNKVLDVNQVVASSNGTSSASFKRESSNLAQIDYHFLVLAPDAGWELGNYRLEAELKGYKPVIKTIQNTAPAPDTSSRMVQSLEVTVEPI